MRLTFRRLLAYLDGVLDEQDVEVVGQKISESKVASQLIHRIQNAKTRDRLGAPRVHGAGMGLDPNTVAEYLDYTLDEERVPDFETVCFESDVHLAEVSASHEILTLVLAEPAQVERSIRERIYHVPDEVRDGRRSRHGQDGPGQSANAHARSNQPAAANISATAAASSAPTPEVDAMREMAEYLDERNEVRWRSLLLTAALSFLLVLVGLRAIGKFDHTHPVLGRILASGANTTSPDETSPEQTPALASDQLTSPPDEAPNSAGENVGPAPGDGSPLATAPLPDATDDADPQADPQPIEPGPPPVPPGLDGSAPPKVVDDGQPVTPLTSPTEPAPALPDSVPAEDTGAAPPLVKPDPGDEPLVAAADDSTPDGAEPAPTTTSIGLFNTPEEVLARFQESDKSWRRLVGRDVIRVGDRLRVPPFYRPHVAFAGALQMTIVGPAELNIMAPQDGRPQIQLVYGQVIVETVATANLSASLNLGEQQGVLLLKSPDSAVAMSVNGYCPAGLDPETESQRAAVWSTLRGDAMWARNGDMSVPGIPLPMGQRLAAIGAALQAPQPAPAPAWATEPKSDALVLAAKEAEKNFDPSRAISLTLEELLNHRMADVRSAATQALTEAGNFRPFIQSLKSGNREDNYDFYYRRHEYAAMRSAISRGGKWAQALKTTLAREFEGDPEMAQRIFELCRGFNNQQLAGGQAVQLIQDLASEEQAVRILAFENLRRITGKAKTYNPLKDPESQKTGIANWTKVLEAGEVKWAAVPGPFETIELK